MPYSIRKSRCRSCGEKTCYRVMNTKTKEVRAKCTTLAKAKKQVRLLHAVDHGWRPTGMKSKSKSRSRKRSKMSRRR